MTYSLRGKKPASEAPCPPPHGHHRAPPKSLLLFIPQAKRRAHSFDFILYPFLCMAPFIYLFIYTQALKKKRFFLEGGAGAAICFLSTLLGKHGFESGLAEEQAPPSKWRRRNTGHGHRQPLSAAHPETGTWAWKNWGASPSQ